MALAGAVNANASFGLRARRESGMTIRLYTDDELAKLRSMPKRVTNPGARWVTKPGHRQRNFQVTGREDLSASFAVYQRQSGSDTKDFSCGIAYLPQGGSRLTLARYNGSSHVHGDIAYHPHIHNATERSIADGRKPESEAEETDLYTTLDGAFRCLILDFQLQGIAVPPPDEPTLPYGS